MKTTITTPAHPCFDVNAKNMHARVHLPVAARCNIQCNYCNRKYDCVNESRPGVTSAVLTPKQALAYLKDLHTRLNNISVIGIAGPGDPFANPDETLETIRLIKEAFPDKIFCLSTNGLNLLPYIDEIASLGVSHVTLTINAVDPEISSAIYAWVRHDKKVYRGIEAAKLLLSKQLESIGKLKYHGITVKINSIILPGINDHHFIDLAKKVSELGADVLNCIPVFPVAETAFGNIEKPSQAMIFKSRLDAGKYIEIMSHCSRCRADAAGLLGHDIDEAFGLIQEYASGTLNPEEDRPYVAVATYEGLLVNQHLGEAKSLYIYSQTPNGFKFLGERETPAPGTGDFRWMKLANTLHDCRALLVSGVGGTPLTILQRAGIRVIQMTGIIDEGLDAVFFNKPLKSVKKPDSFKCGSECRGTANGCA